MLPRILVADDDGHMLRLYARVFSGQAYAVTYADSVAAAAALINRNHYDLLVTDLMLGDGLGTELARLFSKKFSGAKSLMVTGSPPEPEVLDLFSILDCMCKPLEPEKFLAAVSKALA
jgi:two-component system response regulator HydG